MGILDGGILDTLKKGLGMGKGDTTPPAPKFNPVANDDVSDEAKAKIMSSPKMKKAVKTNAVKQLQPSVADND
jgi:hypothetical protein